MTEALADRVDDTVRIQPVALSGLAGEATGADLSMSFEAAKAYLTAIGLFDEGFYRAIYPDVAEAGIDPFEHFFLHGYKEGRRPNAIFDPVAYLEANRDVRMADVQPLLHYAAVGEREGRRPGPLFDPLWYRTRYRLSETQNALAHYLRNRVGPFSPIPEFDADYYLANNPDVAEAKVDPFEHYVHSGYREGRNPSPDFDSRFYVQRYLKGRLDENPLLHYLRHAHLDGYYPKAPEGEATIPAEVKRFARPSVHFEETRPIGPTVQRRAKVLAYYLTQFHSFPENDRWWGTGFTEWTNIARALPRFKDHYQPRIPRDLGFYTLEDVNVMRRQAELAQNAGVHGFVYYYYWFNRKRLLEKPLEQFLKTPDISMPFCLMWANENWTRRWDGMESEVLISQNYLGDDDDALIADLARHFADKRYIRVDGRPLFMIYRPRLIPQTADVIERWRRYFETRFGEKPLFVMSQSFDDFDPRVFGLDGAIEFPPHKHTRDLPRINHEVALLDDTFSGNVFSYDSIVDFSLNEPKPDFPLIKTVVPSWDNDARRQGTGLVITGSTPAKYESWLATLVERAQRDTFFGESFVCVNAWNEWAEGAYLEPDLHFGSAYLNATARAVAGITADKARPRLLLVGHDAFPSGAQQLLLSIGRTLKGSFGVDVEFLLLGGGQLEEEYRSVAPLSVVTDAATLRAKVAGYRERGITSAICNTSVSGHCTAMLVKEGMRAVMLVHELPRILHEKNLAGAAATGIAAADSVIFPSVFVRDQVLEALDITDNGKVLVRPQGSYKQIQRDPDAGARIRAELGIAEGETLVLGVGYADLRKGFDLFHQAWRQMQGRGPRVHFCWVGGIDPSLSDWLGREVRMAKASGTFHMAGFRKDVEAFFSAANAFLLSSREDPFPTVALEAMSAGVPVFAFDGTGGIPHFLKERGLGLVAPYCDVPAMASLLRGVLTKGPDAGMLAKAAEVVEREFGFAPYVRDLLHLALPDLPSVSVVVPNYNYADCLPQRLQTIFDQSHPIEEIIVLDDCSTDRSIDVIMELAETAQRDVSLVINETNSGSVFAQWAKAAEMATGEFVWIAEADDQSDPTFLSSVLSLMRTDPAIAFCFSDSRAIDAEGAQVYASYKPYYATIEPNALTTTRVYAGRDFVEKYLSIKNAILNVSAVVWRRDVLQAAIAACRRELSDLKMAGDWRLYIEALSAPGARIGYVADPLNVHRRHANSVTHSLKAQRHLDEIKICQSLVRRRFDLPFSIRGAQDGYFADVTGQLLGTGPATAGKPGTPQAPGPQTVTPRAEPVPLAPSLGAGARAALARRPGEAPIAAAGRGPARLTTEARPRA
ncbi:MAG: glycoside hydrolase family 99-like domain-containing protein [Labrys sp. (in: a-proteobacteria)]